MAIVAVPVKASAPSPQYSQTQQSDQFVGPTIIYPRVSSVQRIQTLSEREIYWTPILREYAIRFGADPDLIVRVVRCESGFNPSAQNSTSTASGLFQFIDGTWKSQSAKYGVYTTKNDPYGQIEVATRMIAAGGITHWNASKSCWNRL